MVGKIQQINCKEFVNWEKRVTKLNGIRQKVPATEGTYAVGFSKITQVQGSF